MSKHSSLLCMGRASFWNVFYTSGCVWLLFPATENPWRHHLGHTLHFTRLSLQYFCETVTPELLGWRTIPQSSLAEDQPSCLQDWIRPELLCCSSCREQRLHLLSSSALWGSGQAPLRPPRRLPGSSRDCRTAQTCRPASKAQASAAFPHHCLPQLPAGTAVLKLCIGFAGCWATHASLWPPCGRSVSPCITHAEAW